MVDRLIVKLKNFLLVATTLFLGFTGLLILINTGSIIQLLVLITLPSLSALLYKVIREILWRNKLKKSNMKDVDKMDGIQFEYFLEEVFKDHGYKVKVTTASKDFGADLILVKGNEKIAIQAKRYNQKVGIRAVQEIRAAVDYYNAETGWVVTNSYYTNEAKKLAKTNKIRLIDRVGLTTLILQMNAEEVPEVTPYSEPSEDVKICPECDSVLVQRKSRRGYFFGCTSYPKCTYTES